MMASLPVHRWVTASFHRKTITEHLALLFVLPHAQNLLTRSDRLPVRGHNAPPRTLFPALTSDSFFCVSRFLEALVDPIRLGNYYATFISRSTYEVLNGHEDFNTCSTERDWVLTDDEIASWLTPARDMYEEWGRNVDIPERLEWYLRGEDTPPTDILPIKYRPPGSSKSGKVWAGRVKAKRGDAGREALVSNAVSYVVVEDDEESENSVSMGADSVAAAQTQAQFMDDHHSNSESQAISSEGGQIDGALDVSRRDALMEGEELLLRRRAVRSARRSRNRSGLDELDEEYGASGPAKHGARGSHQMITRNSNKRVVVEADAEAAEDEDENEGVGTGSSSRRRRDHQLVLRDEERRRSASATASSVHPPTARPRTAGRLQIRSAKAIAIENAEQEGLGMPSGLAGGLGLPARGYIDGRRYLNTPHISYGVGIASGVPGQSSDFNASLLLQGRSAVHRPPLTPNSNNSYPNGGYYVQQPMPTGSSPSYPHYATGVPYPNMLGSAAGAPNISHYNNNLDYRLGNKNAHLHHPYYFNSQAFVSGPPRHLLTQPYAPYNARSSLVNSYSSANNYPNVSAGTFDPTAPYRRLAKKASGANGEGFAENVNSSTGTVSNITIGTVGVDGDGGNLYRGNVGSSAGTVSNITIGTAGIGGDGGSRYRGNIGSSAGTVSNISIGTVGIVGDGGNLGRGNIDSSLTTLGPKNVNIVETSAPRSAIVINATENYLKGDYGVRSTGHYHSSPPTSQNTRAHSITPHIQLQSLPHNRHLPHEQHGNRWPLHQNEITSTKSNLHSQSSQLSKGPQTQSDSTTVETDVTECQLGEKGNNESTAIKSQPRNFQSCGSLDATGRLSTMSEDQSTVTKWNTIAPNALTLTAGSGNSLLPQSLVLSSNSLDLTPNSPFLLFEGSAPSSVSETAPEVDWSEKSMVTTEVSADLRDSRRPVEGEDCEEIQVRGQSQEVNIEALESTKDAAAGSPGRRSSKGPVIESQSKVRGKYHVIVSQNRKAKKDPPVLGAGLPSSPVTFADAVGVGCSSTVCPDVPTTLSGFDLCASSGDALKSSTSALMDSIEQLPPDYDNLIVFKEGDGMNTVGKEEDTNQVHIGLETNIEELGGAE